MVEKNIMTKEVTIEGMVKEEKGNCEDCVPTLLGLILSNPGSFVEAILEGNPGTVVRYKDLGAPEDKKWFELRVVGGKARFQSIKDDGSLNKIIFEVDLGTGEIDFQDNKIKNVDGIHKTGNYTGNGTSQSIDVGFQPKTLKIIRWNETYPCEAQKNDQMQGDDYLRINSDGTPVIDLANGITLTETGFDLGSDSTINADGNTYYWEAYG